MDKHLDDSAILLHDFEDNSKYFGAVAPPIMQTSLFCFEDWDQFLGGITAERNNYVYSRGVNPTTEILEKKLASLERGEKCKCFASGMAAISSTMFTFLKQGDHILFVNNCYGPAVAYSKALEKFGVENTNIYINDSKEVEKHIKENTRMIYVESPSTMNFDLLDLEVISKMAKERGILTAIDNTWATPLYQKPLTMGFDLVLHSCTKYMGGHSDTVGGCVVGSYELVDKVFEIGHQFGGGLMSPFDAWLILRGMRTLNQRLAFQSESIRKVVEVLSAHEKVRKINHPLVYTGEQKKLFEKQMKGYTSLFSIEVDFKDYDDVRNFFNSLKMFKLGVSWGGFESLAITPNYNTEASKEGLKNTNINKDTVRIYIGLEETDLLIKDLLEALDKVK